MTRRTLLAAAVCALLTQAVSGGQTPASSQQPPTFRAETRAIDVDVYVTDPQGAFVSGLTRDDFELLEDGQPQDISAFTLVNLPVERAPASPTPRKGAPPPPSPDVSSNAVDGRIYVMLLDSPGLRPSRRAAVTLEQMVRLTQQVATQFVNEALGPKDLMAVIHVQGNRSDAQSFTSDKALLRAAIARMKPDLDLFGVKPGDKTFPERYCDIEKIRNSYDVLEAVSEYLGAATGRRRAVLWVNGGVPLDGQDPDECGFQGAEAGSLLFMKRDAIRAATRNNVAIYPIDPRGLAADPRYYKPEPPGTAAELAERKDKTATPGNPDPEDEPPARRAKRLAALRGIAEDTGGDAILNTNNFSGGFERVVQLHSTYYLLGYRPARDHQDGQFHSITVRVRPPNLSVRARKGYLAPEPGAQPGGSAPAVAALFTSLPSSSGLGIRLFLAPFRGTGGNASVVAGTEIGGVTRTTGVTDRLEISYVVVDSQGATRKAPPKMLALSADGAVAGGSSAIRNIDRLPLPPGRHEVRMVVQQPGGAGGSIVAYVDVPDFTRDPLAMSGLLLALAGAAPQARRLGDARLNAVLSDDPTTARRFTRRDMVTAVVEVYTDARTRVESVVTTASITTTRGEKVRTEAATRGTSEAGRAIDSTRLSLADLMPGDYVLTMEAKTGRRTVSRQVSFSVVTE